MASYAVSEYYESSSFPSVAQRLEIARKSFTEKCAESGDDAEINLLAVYLALEEESRESPHYHDGLMTAI